MFAWVSFDLVARDDAFMLKNADPCIVADVEAKKSQFPDCVHCWTESLRLFAIKDETGFPLVLSYFALCPSQKIERERVEIEEIVFLLHWRPGEVIGLTDRLAPESKRAPNGHFVYQGCWLLRNGVHCIGDFRMCWIDQCVSETREVFWVMSNWIDPW